MLVSASEHEAKKQQLLKQFADRVADNPNGIGLEKNTSNLFRPRRLKNYRLDVRHFNRVISIDKKNMLAEVEGMTTYEDLVAETLKYDCLPTVVPELKSITIGGALSGVGIESSSFRYGLVHETIVEFDVLTGDGQVITCRADNEHKDLFYAFPNSYGTLGYALKIQVKLIPAKKYIKLNYVRFTHAKDFFEHMQTICMSNHQQGSVAYVDGVIFTPDEMYIAQAHFVDDAPYLSNYKFMKIYYKSIRNKKTDYLTTLDYIWRWDPDWFWCSKVFYLQNPLLRFLFGKFLLKSTAYWKLMHFARKNPLLRAMLRKFEKPKESVIQDVAIPIESTQKFYEFFHRYIGISPVWTCPIIPYNKDIVYSLFKMNSRKMYVNFGFWDMISSNKEKGYYNKLIEQQVQKLGGNKSLYSSVYYNEDEFWQIYDKSLYRELKNKYDPHQYLNDLYRKCTEKEKTQ